MTGGIYIITNTESQKCYIGSTVNVKKRWGCHRCGLRNNTHGNSHLQHAWNKYGEASFEFGVLEYFGNSKKLYLTEQFWIDVYREEGKDLYNIALATNCPMSGRKHSEETKLKMSASQKGHTHTEATKNKIRKIKLGGKHTEESIQKMRDAKAKAYPAFINKKTGEVIPPGSNLTALCREQELDVKRMCGVKTGRLSSHKGWVLDD